MANVAAATNARPPSRTRTENSSTTCARWGRSTPNRWRPIRSRLTTNRNSAYSQPLSAKALATGLPSFDTRQCSARDHRLAQRRTPRTNQRSTNGPKGERQPKRTTSSTASRNSPSPNQDSTDHRPGPRLHPAGPVRADLRQRAPGDHLPAHLRTGRLAPGALEAPAEGGEDDPGRRRGQREQLLDREAGDVGDGRGGDHEAVSS